MDQLKLVISFTRVLLRRKYKQVLFFSMVVLVFWGILWFSQDFLSRSVVSEGFVGTFQERDLPDYVTKLLSQSLVELDPSGIPKPALAEKWEIKNEAKEYIFTLKPNLKWSDGTAIKASEIDFGVAAQVEAIDDKTIKFTLDDSFSPFPTLLTNPIFKKGTLIGTGPYQISQVKKDSIFIKRLKLYSNNKQLPDVVIKFYPNEKIAKNALKLGEIQALMGVAEYNDFLSDKHLTIWSKTNYNQLVTIFYNTQDKILSDDNLRLALSYGAPVIPGEVRAVSSIPDTSWAFNKDIRQFLDNADQSKAYLKKAKPGDLPLVLTVTSSLKGVGDKVIEAWTKLGIKAQLQVESGIPQNFQALLITQNIPTDPDQYSLWHSTQKETNISKLSDGKFSPRIDKDLEDGRKAIDIEVRKQKYADFQKSLLDHAPATFLYFPKYNIIYFKKIHDDLNKVVTLQV